MNARSAPQAPLVAHRARAGRGRLHRRRLPDRRPAGARSAVRQPLGQPVRHLRRDQRRLADRVAGGQRRHARADDAHGQRPGAVRASAASSARCCCASTRREFALKALKLPLHAISVARNVAASLGSLRAPSTSCSRSATRCPRASTPAQGIEDYLRKALSEEGRTDDFRLLERELYLAATDLDTCERIVLGAEGWDDVPISSRRPRLDRAADDLRAVPGAGPRARRRRHRLDHQPRHRGRGGREVHRRRQPARPLRQRLHQDDPDAVRHPRRGASRTWASRRSATRRSSCSPTSACTRWRSHWKERYPGVDIVLVEPDPDDELMFQTNILNFASRVDVARHGFESVTLKLAKDYDEMPRGLPPPRHRDLGDARPQGRPPLLRRAREDPRLAAHPRADHRRAAASERGSGLARSARSGCGGRSAPCYRRPGDAARGGLPRPIAGVRFLAMRAPRMLARYRRRYGDVFAVAVWPFDPLVGGRRRLPRSSGSSVETRSQLHAGEGNRVRRTDRSADASVLVLDEKVVDPAHPQLCCLRSHGARCGSTAPSCAELTEAEGRDLGRPAWSSRCCERCSGWRCGSSCAAVFGVDEGARIGRARALADPADGAGPADHAAPGAAAPTGGPGSRAAVSSRPPAPRSTSCCSPRSRGPAERRLDGEDVLSMLLQARGEDGRAAVGRRAARPSDHAAARRPRRRRRPRWRGRSSASSAIRTARARGDRARGRPSTR